MSLGVGILVLWLASQIELRTTTTDSVGPRWWPEQLGVGIIALSAALLLIAIVRPPQDRSDLAAATRPGWLKMSATVAATALYFWAWPNIGFLISTVLYIGGLVLLFGGRSWKAALAFPVGTTALLYVLFHYLLRVPL